MAWIPSIQQLGIRQLGSQELRKSWFENIRNSKVQEHTEGHDLKHHRLRSRGLRYVWIIWQNSFVGPKIERNWKNRRQQKKSRRMLSMNGIEEQFRCNKPYSKDIRRMNVVLIFPWCRTSGIHGNADFSTLNKKSRIFICNDTTVLQICRLTHFHQTKTWPHAFPVCLACGQAKARETLLIPSVSICIIAQILEQKLWPFNVKA